MQKTNIEEYDYVILGTGLSESIISMLIAEKRKKVLVVDRFQCYGSEFATLSYVELLEHFGIKSNEVDLVTKTREFNIDLTPKLLMNESDLKNLIVEKEIHKIVGFSAVVGSYLYNSKLHVIPRNEAQSMQCSAIGFIQKTKVARFFYNLRHVAKRGYVYKKRMIDEFNMFGLDKLAVDFIGHGIAMEVDNEYLKKCPKITYNKILRYVQSIVSYDNSESPFIYPHYGLSDICQAFVRKAACNGAEFMINTKIMCINTQNNTINLIDPDGNGHEIKYGKMVADPSYFTLDILDCCKSVVSKRIIRCIMILKKNKKYLGSRNITFLHSSLNRSNDVFVVVLDSKTRACPPEYEIGILSTVQETDNPEAEIAPILSKFDTIKHFIEIRNVYANDDTESVIFTTGVNENPMMDEIYDDVQTVLKKLDIN
ncbi:GDI1 [Enterospora canceri]|uniref:Rab GDP dissociation inhibitor n=1 Tax=Enterospora canceri TaxID=1081671 RepID=A0A1Y1S6P5_9MICR|nr:GDI1 [Enterospora canceri]